MRRAGSSRADAVATGSKSKKAKGRKPSSQRWLRRQANDPYVAGAKAHGYRSRAAWKLAQLDERFHFLNPGLTVVDLGAAPGGWTQVAVERNGPARRGGKVLAVDLVDIEPVPGAISLRLDADADEAAGQLTAALKGSADVVLSDMAAPATGHRGTDHLRSMILCEAAHGLACRVLAPGGVLVLKILKGGDEAELMAALKRNFTSVRHAKPPASRKESSEDYVIATGFRAVDIAGG